MDIQQEINTHLEWIEKIAELLGDSSITDDDILQLSQHDKCELGRWLNSDESKTYRGSPAFNKLVESHDNFHRLAGSMMDALQNGDEDGALDTEAQFIEMSQQVIANLNALKENQGR